MLQHVYERASLARYLSKVIIATDDERIRAEAQRFGGAVRLTRSDHLSGTDRVAEVASAENCELVVNIQGDEPMIDPSAVDASVVAMLENPEIPMGTLKKRIDLEEQNSNPNVVKVVTDFLGNAIYFSRSPIPYSRDEAERRLTPCYKHIGLYVYRREFLLAYSDLPVGPLEKAERLEQLRALENGYSIRVIETDYDSIGVDTPEDLEQMSHLFSLKPV